MWLDSILNWFEKHQGLGSWLQGLFALAAIITTLIVFGSKESADKRLRFEKDAFKARLLVLELLPSFSIVYAKLKAVLDEEKFDSEFNMAVGRGDFKPLQYMDPDAEIAVFTSVIPRCDCLDVKAGTELARMLAQLRMYDVQFDLLRRFFRNQDASSFSAKLIPLATQALTALDKYDEAVKCYLVDASKAG